MAPDDQTPRKVEVIKPRPELGQAFLSDALDRPSPVTVTTPHGLQLSPRRLSRLVIASSLAVVALLVIGSVLVLTLGSSHKATTYKTTKATLPTTSSDNLKLQDVLVNGQLYVNNGVVLKPSSQPSNPSLGQLYVSSDSHDLSYFNGSTFVSLKTSASPAETVLGVSSNLLKLGAGLTLNQNTIQNSGVTNLLGTQNQIAVSTTTGSVTLGLPNDVSIPGNLTSSSLTTGNLLASTITATSLSGNGSNLTNLNASNLSNGTVADTRLSPNVALLAASDQVFHGRRQVFQNTNNDTSAFSIQAADGTKELTIDTINHTVTTGDLFPRVPGSIAPGPTTITVVNTGNQGFRYHDSQKWIANGPDGLQRLVYFDNNYHSVEFVQCTDAACDTSNKTTITTDTNGVDEPLIVMGSDGLPRISYINYNTPNELHYVQCTSADCTGRADTLVDTASKQYFYDTSLVLGSDGLARITYTDYGYNPSQSGLLKFIQCTNASCSTKNITTLVPNGDGELGAISTAVGTDGFIRIAYVDDSASPHTLNFIRCANAGCSAHTASILNDGSTLNSSNNGMYYDSMAIGHDGLPQIAYTDRDVNGNAQLQFIHCSNADCTAPVSHTVDNSASNSGNDYSETVSLAVGSDGLARLDYVLQLSSNNGSSEVIKYAQCTAIDCSTAHLLTIDNAPGDQYMSSMVLGTDGYGRIAYVNNDGTNNNLKLVRLYSDSGMAAQIGTNIGSSTAPFNSIYAQQIHTASVNSGTSGQLLVQGTANATNAFTVQDAASNALLNVDSVHGTTTISTATPTTLGSNLITNTDFTSAAWSGANWTMAPTAATYAGTGNDALTTNQFTPTIGDTYQLSYTISNNTNGGCIQVSLGGATGSNQCASSTTVIDTLTASTTAHLSFIPSTAPFNGTISNVSVQQVLTNPALVLTDSTNATSNPLLSVDAKGILTLNHLGATNGSTSLCLNGSNQVAGCTNGTYWTASGNDIQNTNSGNVIVGGGTTNSSAAFQVQDASANQVLTVDTVNGTIGVAGAPTTSGYTLNIAAPKRTPVAAPIVVTNIGTPGQRSYSYEVIGLNGSGVPLAGYPSLGATYTGNNTLSATNYNSLSWPAIPGAASYNVYRISVSFGAGGLIGNTTSASMNDTGTYSASYPPNYAKSLSTPNNWGTGQTNSVVQGGFLYAASNTNTFIILDISNPANPTPMSQLALSGNPDSIAVSGSYAYVESTASGNSTLQIINISDPANPSIVGQVTKFGEIATNIVVSGNNAYVANYSINNFDIFDISDSSNPTFVASTSQSSGTNGAASVYVRGTYAYLLADGRHLEVYNIANPSSPTLVSSNTLIPDSGTPYGIYGNYMYIGVMSHNTTYIININNPLALNLAGSVPFLFPTYWPHEYSGGFATVGHIAYASGNETTNSIYLYDLSNPVNPILLGGIPSTCPYTYGLALKTSYLYLDTGCGLETYNITAVPQGGLSVSGQTQLNGDLITSGNLSAGQSFQSTGSAFFQDSSNSTTAFQVQNSSGANLLNVDTANNITRLGSTTYNTGSISQGGTTVNGSGVTFTQAMVGGTLIYSDGTSSIITGYTNSTSLTVSVSKSVASGSIYQIVYGGVSLGSNGSVLLQSTTNSTTAFQVQNSSGTALLTADTTNMTLTVQTLVINTTLTVNGHIITGGTTPGIVAGANAGTGASVSITGNDESGTITVNTGTAPTAGTLATITFASAYGAVPNVVLTPVGNISASVQYNLGSSSANNFTLNSGSAPAATKTYTYKYLVVQ